jgi:hypothetical protein
LATTTTTAAAEEEEKKEALENGQLDAVLVRQELIRPNEVVKALRQFVEENREPFRFVEIRFFLRQLELSVKIQINTIQL